MVSISRPNHCVKTVLLTLSTEPKTSAALSNVSRFRVSRPEKSSETESQAPGRTSQRPKVTSQPAKRPSQPTKETSQGSNRTSHATKATPQAAKGTSQPAEQTSQPEKMTSQASKVTSQASKITSQGPKTTSQVSNLIFRKRANAFGLERFGTIHRFPTTPRPQESVPNGQKSSISPAIARRDQSPARFQPATGIFTFRILLSGRDFSLLPRHRNVSGQAAGFHTATCGLQREAARFPAG